MITEAITKSRVVIFPRNCILNYIDKSLKYYHDKRNLGKLKSNFRNLISTLSKLSDMSIFYINNIIVNINNNDFALKCQVFTHN